MTSSEKAMGFPNVLRLERENLCFFFSFCGFVGWGVHSARAASLQKASMIRELLMVVVVVCGIRVDK